MLYVYFVVVIIINKLVRIGYLWYEEENQDEREHNQQACTEDSRKGILILRECEHTDHADGEQDGRGVDDGGNVLGIIEDLDVHISGTEG